MYLDNRPPPPRWRRTIEKFVSLYWQWILIGFFFVWILYGVLFSPPEPFYWVEP